ncbi:hypothetical protein QCA50_008998 [Cerrena zonata]|uniref:Fungal-type protein kinase domain-containing protein n=1 Tax=Cerrena zonata TaxID=2478898 RepID=A0AAW0G838_9APHY
MFSTKCSFNHLAVLCPTSRPMYPKQMIGCPDPSYTFILSSRKVVFCGPMSMDPFVKRPLFTFRPQSYAPSLLYRRSPTYDVSLGRIVSSLDQIVCSTSHITTHEKKLGDEQTARRPTVHTRIAVLKIGQPLGEFVKSIDLIIGVTYAFTAHEEAWKIGAVHCDISENNILLVYDEERVFPRGLLIDWDLSEHPAEIDIYTPSNINNRRGTWAFMSALQQRYPKKPYHISDDIESFVHVILFCAIRYMSRDTVENLSNIIWGMFGCCIQHEDGLLTGSPRKWAVVTSGQSPFTLVGAEENLAELISILLTTCKTHYDSLNLQYYEKYCPSKVQSQSTTDHPQGPTFHFRSDDITRELGEKAARMIAIGARERKIGESMLDDHTVIAQILSQMLKRDGWPSTRDGKIDNLFTS